MSRWNRKLLDRDAFVSGFQSIKSPCLIFGHGDFSAHFQETSGLLYCDHTKEVEI